MAEAVEIPLNKGFTALIDLADFPLVSQFNWHVVERKRAVTRYARSASLKKGGRTLHQFLLGDPPPGHVIDHINGNGLDNRRSNLRFATHQQSLWNRGLNRNSTSGYKGVSFNKKSGFYSVCIGGFQTAEEAARAADVLMRMAHGEFARLNFPEVD